MQCQFIYLLCVISFIPNVSSSGVITNCFFVENVTDSVELVCGAHRGSYLNDDCFLRLFSLDTAFSNYRANVKHLKTGCCTSSSLRGRFFESFSHLRVLDLSHFGVEVLSDLRLKYLRIFNVSHNKLTTIKATNFRHMPDIREIDLAFNELSTLEYGTFSRLRELRTLNLSFNSIDVIEHDPFKNNKKLEIVHLENNPIKRIDSNIFLLLKRSVSVGISCDKVTEIDSSGLETALRIEFSNNCELFFRVLYHGVGLKCMGNVFQNLTHLNVSGNHLENAVQIVDSLGPSIEILDLTSNHIANACSEETDGCSINARLFKRFTNLQILNLSRTNLTHFQVEAFQYMKNLTRFELSYNQLRKLEFGSVVFSNLNALKLEGNQLTDGWAINEINFPKLVSLSISQNHFSCEYMKKFMEKWKNSYLITDSTNQNIDCEEETKVNEQSTEPSDNDEKMRDGQQELDERHKNNKNGDTNEVDERDKTREADKSKNGTMQFDENNGKMGEDDRVKENERYEIDRSEMKQTEGIVEFTISGTTGSIETTQRNEEIGTTENAEIIKTTVFFNISPITEQTNEITKTKEDMLQTESVATTETINRRESTDASTIITTQNMETTTDINTSDKNEGDFTSDAIQSSSDFTEFTTTESPIVSTDYELHNNLETTTKVVISNVLVSRTQFSQPIIFAPKYDRKRKSLKIASQSRITKCILVLFLVISVGYLIVKLRCTRRFKRNLKGNSNRLHVPYKLDQLDGFSSVELIDHLDFRQYRVNVNENEEQCEFD